MKNFDTIISEIELILSTSHGDAYQWRATISKTPALNEATPREFHLWQLNENNDVHGRFVNHFDEIKKKHPLKLDYDQSIRSGETYYVQLLLIQ